ncbi:MAG: hypothetical protein KDC71_18505, partial [Acidobacteria bacterium]|nr:hypothetical protein [Acidobacteriota bacterium]
MASTLIRLGAKHDKPVIAEGRLYLGEEAVALNFGAIKPLVDPRRWIQLLALLMAMPMVWGQWHRASAFKAYNQESGLAQNSVTAIQTDSHGFLWFGTQDGLHRFDGKSFELFRPKPGGLNGGFISDLCLDAQQRLWVATLQSGINVYLGEGRFQSWSKENSGLAENRISFLRADPEQGVWVATSHHLQRFDGLQGWEMLRDG